MDPATEQRLVRGATALGIELQPSAVLALARYLALLQQWNRHINLTAIDDPNEVVDRHFLDSLALLPLLPERGSLLDVGSGAGFPGVVLAVVRPELAVTCIEPTQKKIAFLRTLRRELKVSVEPIAVRDEALRAAGRLFDIAVSRATWDPSEWLEHGAPFVRPGGLLLAMLTDEHPALSPPPDFSALPPHPYQVASISRRIERFTRH